MKKFNDYLVGIIFFSIGIVFLIVKLVMSNIDNQFIQNAYKTVGTIQSITVDYGIDDDYDVYVSYKDYLGENHVGKSNYSSSFM